MIVDKTTPYVPYYRYKYAWWKVVSLFIVFPSGFFKVYWPHVCLCAQGLQAQLSLCVRSLSPLMDPFLHKNTRVPQSVIFSVTLAEHWFFWTEYIFPSAQQISSAQTPPCVLKLSDLRNKPWAFLSLFVVSFYRHYVCLISSTQTSSQQQGTRVDFHINTSKITDCRKRITSYTS